MLQDFIGSSYFLHAAETEESFMKKIMARALKQEEFRRQTGEVFQAERRA